MACVLGVTRGHSDVPVVIADTIRNGDSDSVDIAIAVLDPKQLGISLCVAIAVAVGVVIAVAVTLYSATTQVGHWRLDGVLHALWQRRHDAIRLLRHLHRHSGTVAVLSRSAAAAVPSHLQHTAVCDAVVEAGERLERVLGAV